ncbi:hypothetical protein A3Q56_06606 [Intoshia linei]|uniref:Uncharacterized protein n=1 Tax=Intoshia linei TaxID=1819745 RepID=A0A177AWB7_9BILA|nr:hypothetical protein A3Q56_06606 [Intoshia linei]
MKFSNRSTVREIYEASIERRRRVEQNNENARNSATQFYNRGTINAQKLNEWENSRNYHEQKQKQQNESDIFNNKPESEQIKRRRDKMSQLYNSEANQYTNALKQSKLDGDNEDKLKSNFDLDSCNKRIDYLRTQRETERKKLSDNLLMEREKQRNLEFRKYKSNLENTKMKNHWKYQIEEKNILKNEQENKNKELENELNIIHQNQLKIENNLALEKQEILDQNRRDLEYQIQSLVKRKEEQQVSIRAQEDLILKENKRQSILEQQKLINLKRKNIKYGAKLLKQHKTAMMRRSEIIKNELQEDLDILQQLKESETTQDCQKLKFKNDFESMREMLAKQKELEKLREQQLELLFNDEAARMWDKREEEWRRERLARQKLMDEVILERSQQTKENLIKNENKKNLAKDEIDRIMHQLEKLKFDRKNEIDRKINSQREYKLMLENQINEKKSHEKVTSNDENNMHYDKCYANRIKNEISENHII